MSQQAASRGGLFRSFDQPTRWFTGLAVVAVCLLAVNLRTAVSSLSPVLPFIGEDIPLSTAAIGILGMVAPLCFAAAGVVYRPIVARLDLTHSALLILVVIVVGSALRTIAPSVVVIICGTVLALLAMGVGNVILPSLVREYFPQRIPLMTTAYTILISVSAFVPPFLAVPVAENLGWRFSLSQWVILAMVGALPWVGLVVVRRSRAKGRDDVRRNVPRSGSIPVWKSPTAWAITVIFTVSSLNAYVMYGLMPTMLQEHSGLDAGQAGFLLGVFAVMGLPAALVVPVLVAKYRATFPLVIFGFLCFALGYLGLMLFPDRLAWLWVALLGSGPVLFPMCLTLFNIRTNTSAGTIALSGFAQGVGYCIAALGPLGASLVHSWFGSWTPVLAILLGTTVAPLLAGFILQRGAQVEEELS